MVADNQNQVKKGRMTQNAIDNLMVAIGGRAIKDFVRAMRKYNRLAKEPESLQRKTRLFRADHRMVEAARFFLNDPYEMFPNGGGKNIVIFLKRKYKFRPVDIPTQEEYDEIIKSIEK